MSFRLLTGSLVAFAAAAFVCAGCSNRRSVLFAGVHFGVISTRHVVTDDEALKARGTIRADWHSELARRAHERGGFQRTFANLSPGEFRRRLEAAAQRHDFDILSVTFEHPSGLAPMVVVKTTHYVALARALPAIERRLDPKQDTGDDRTGWAYEGFYFEADDERGIPFVITTNALRDKSPGGGQWARSDALFPYEHG
jgi:hypothetical protein